MLCVQLSRKQKVNEKVISHTHKVNVDKTIMLDRFMNSNTEKLGKIRKDTKPIRKQIKLFQNQVQAYVSISTPTLCDDSYVAVQ